MSQMKISRLGIMQPYLFPYAGYFCLIKHTEKWIVFDTVQYINRGWINRNIIQSPSQTGTSYLTVPILKVSNKMLIKDAKIDHTQDWKEKIIGQIAFYKKKAPYYSTVSVLVRDIVSYKTDYICELNIHALCEICQYLNICFDYSIFSKDRYGIEFVNEPDEWALEISKKLNASSYINPPGGKEFFNKKKYDEAGVKLFFLKHNMTPYNNSPNGFIDGLSILDVMMYNSPDEINLMLDNYEFT